MQSEVRLPGLGGAATIHGACIVLVEAGWLFPPKMALTEVGRHVPGQPAGANKGCPMSRWTEAFDAVRARDTIDTMLRVGALGPYTVNNVNCVNQGKDANAVVTATPQIVAAESGDAAGGAPCPVQEGLPVIPLDVAQRKTWLAEHGIEVEGI
jgi:hypothetical protein